jgi:hypothetical protein
MSLRIVIAMWCRADARQDVPGECGAGEDEDVPPSSWKRTEKRGQAGRDDRTWMRSNV